MTLWPCPRCGLTWPTDIPWCDCGYVWPGLPDVYVDGVLRRKLVLIEKDVE